MELKGVVLAGKAHVVALLVVQVGVGDYVHVILVPKDDALEDAHGGLRELHHVLRVAQYLTLILFVEGDGDSAGHTHHGVRGLASDHCLDPLSLGTGPEDCAAKLEAYFAYDTQDVPLGHRGRGAHHEVSGCQGIEVRYVAVHEVRIVEQVPYAERCLSGIRVVAAVNGLRGCQVVRAGANAAKPCRNLVQLRDSPAYAESLEASYLGSLIVRLLHISFVVQEDLDLPMALQTGYGVDRYPLGVDLLLLIPNYGSSHLIDLLP